MGNKDIEQALVNLLPTHAHALPPELVNHASALLMQSRSYAGGLKAVEEIARPHACAEIACKRLSKVLQLPPPRSCPPCPLRIYNRLYRYLELALSKAPAGSKRQVRSAGKDTHSPSTTSPLRRSMTSISAPSKLSSAQLSTHPNITPPKQNHPGSPSLKLGLRGAKGQASSNTTSTIIPDAPAWTMPRIRSICRVLSSRASTMSSPVTMVPPVISAPSPPHIFAGISSILFFISEIVPKPDSGDEDIDAEFLSPLMNPDGGSDYRNRMITLIVTVYFIVLARQSRKMDVETYIEMSTQALEANGLTGQQYKDDVDLWISIIMARGWAKGQEWFNNAPGPRMKQMNEQQDAGYDEEPEERDENDIAPASRHKLMWGQLTENGCDALFKTLNQQQRRAEGALLPGLGTMMQDRVDWLSEDKKTDYLTWREGIMEWIETAAHDEDALFNKTARRFSEPDPETANRAMKKASKEKSKKVIDMKTTHWWLGHIGHKRLIHIQNMTQDMMIKAELPKDCTVCIRAKKTRVQSHKAVPRARKPGG